MARTAARHELRRKASPGGPGRWGQPRFSRRTAVGTATATVVASSMLGRVSTAMADDAPCVSPCKSAAVKNFYGPNQSLQNTLGGHVQRIENKIGQLQDQLDRTRGAKARAALNTRIANLQRKELSVLGEWQTEQSALLDEYYQAFDRCKSDGQCGDPQTYPGGAAPPLKPEGGECGLGTTKCAENCCPPGTKCCICKICCIDDVECKDCCPAT